MFSITPVARLLYEEKSLETLVKKKDRVKKDEKLIRSMIVKPGSRKNETGLVCTRL